MGHNVLSSVSDSLLLHCSCRSRRSRWPCRLSELAIEVLKRLEAISSSTFVRPRSAALTALVLVAAGWLSEVPDPTCGANGRLSCCRSPGRQVRRAGGLNGGHRPQAASSPPSLVAGALLAAAERKETLRGLGCRQAKNAGESGCAVDSGRQEGQPGHPSWFPTAFGWPSGRPNRLCRRRRPLTRVVCRRLCCC